MDNTVTLLVQNSPIQCSRSDLIQNSDYFKAMFDGNFLESSKNTITLHDVDATAVKVIFKMLWQSDYTIEEDFLLPVLQAARMLQFIEIGEKCVLQTLEALSVDNCLKFWFFCEQLDIKEIYSKAKLLALLEFEDVKKTKGFFDLTLAEIVRYLSDSCLFVENEFDVFLAAIKWCQHMENKNEDVLISLLHCVDFTVLDKNQIGEIVRNSFIHEFDNLVQMLENTEAFFKPKNRNFHGFPCFLVEDFQTKHNSDEKTVVYLDKYNRKRKYSVLTSAKSVSIVALDLETRIADVELDCSQLDGFKVIGYKQFIFLYGGEYLLGYGNWNEDFLVYNVIKGEWTRKKFLANKIFQRRRHFESCVSGNFLYIVGGTGKFRIVQDNLMWYDILKDEWSREYNLPCSSRQLKCCPFRKNVFVLNINEKCGYEFCQNLATWKRMNIQESNNTLPVYSKKLTLFSYKDKIYIKDKNLFQLKIENGKLLIEKLIELEESVPTFSNYEVESVVSNNMLYSLTTVTNDSVSFFIRLETLNLETFKSVIKYEKSLQGRPLGIVFNAFHEHFVINNEKINL